ncbi:MAG: hypothetical protein CL869_00805 [Cytophagia bacterium]|nr:hypothetical protein [Cytophagia bacterium]
MESLKFKQIDLLKGRRREQYLIAPYFLDNRKFLKKGVYIGLCFILLSLISGSAFILRSNIYERKKLSIKPLVEEYDLLQINLDNESKQLKLVAEFNKNLKNSIVNISSSSALLKEISYLTPDGLQILNLNIEGNLLNLKNKLINKEPLSLINAFLLLLDNSEFINFSEIDLTNIKAEEEEEKSKSFIVSINTKITNNYKNINQKYLNKLGSYGLSNRIDLLKGID